MLQKATNIVNVDPMDGLSKAGVPAKSFSEVNILLKLLPFFDVVLTDPGKSNPEAKDLRRLMGISKSEADMI
jgi:hypothetical protein